MYHILSMIYYLLSRMYHTLSMIYYLLSRMYHILSMIYYLWSIIYELLSISYDVLYIIYSLQLLIHDLDDAGDKTVYQPIYQQPSEGGESACRDQSVSRMTVRGRKMNL